MFSLENFYYTVYINLLESANIIPAYFDPFGSTKASDLRLGFSSNSRPNSFHVKYCLFHDQEPFISTIFNFITILSNKYFKVLANSEISAMKSDICKKENFLDWYYFFHGFAALIWYRDYQYVGTVDHKPKKAFLSLNRLVTNDRSYRLTLVAKMLEKGLVDKGAVSLSLLDHGHGTWEDEINDPKSKLSADSKALIKKYISQLGGPLVVDYEIPKGSLSADAGPRELELNQSCLWHVVPETVFYYDKLHLTEKIFKPIVSHRPFILVAAPGNLAYLKRYGFKTFDRWIDESYDNEPDHDKRIDMITDELSKICKLSPSELDQMHEEMKEVLDFNFDHFYGKFKELIIDEMLDNFKNCVHQWNHGRIDGKEVCIDSINFNKVKQTLLR